MAATLASLMMTVLTQVPLEAAAADGDRNERLQFMRDKLAKFSLYRESAMEPLTLKEEPIVRFTNPERDSGTWDGATFLWLEGARPVAAVSLGIRRPANAVFREFTSFSDTPLVCQRGGAAAWSPRSGGLAARELPGAPLPAETASGRLTQMRNLARRFSATCYYKEDATQLRLMPQPLYRYSDEQEGLLDGGLFAMVVSNDPEMFVLLEALTATGDKAPTWRYSLARMSSLRHSVRLDDVEIWTIPAFYTIPPALRKDGPYLEAFEGNFKPAAEQPAVK
ncbi:MAG TPA: hypothetical protein VKE94_21700 [Gemmataceae bacterium]|nr:hypothetical protein [Gemmataceae bacterium]